MKVSDYCTSAPDGWFIRMRGKRVANRTFAPDKNPSGGVETINRTSAPVESHFCTRINFDCTSAPGGNRTSAPFPTNG